jgi:serine/threonine-protein kinase
MPSEAPARRTTPSDIPLGTVINGRYRLVSLIASGGMGRVYRAEQAPLARIVALKLLGTAQLADAKLGEAFRRRFFLEASILAKLQHVNVVTLFDYGRIEGVDHEQYFMAMEYLAGVTLADRIRDGIGLPTQDALRILRQMARGLREAHKQGAVHRDLKPSNVMLVPESDGGEVVKILDFGIGKLLGGPEDQALTQQGSFLGSPRYVAPEQVNEKRVDARTDVYALGVIAYEMFCGFVPFDRETNLETILAHCSAPLPPMSERNPAVRVPNLVEGFVRRCLEKDPNDRPASMEEVLRGISECERALYGVTSLGASANDLTPAPLPAPRPPLASGAEALDDTLASSPEVIRSAGLTTGSQSLQARSQSPSEHTQSPLTRSGQLSGPGGAAHGGHALKVVAAVAVLACAGAVGLSVRQHITGSAAPLTSTAPAAAASDPPAAAATSFTLVLDSAPSGAEVLENDDLLGTTPMQVTIARDGVRAAPRRFIVRLDGYATYTLLQGDSEGIVHVMAPLTRAPSRGSAPATTAALPPVSRPAPPRAPGSSHASVPATPSPQQDLDIKLTR